MIQIWSTPGSREENREVFKTSNSRNPQTLYQQYEVMAQQ